MITKEEIEKLREKFPIVERGRSLSREEIERVETAAALHQVLDEVERLQAVSKFQDSIDVYLDFHEKHPLANSIEIWGAAMGRKQFEIDEYSRYLTPYGRFKLLGESTKEYKPA